MKQDNRPTSKRFNPNMLSERLVPVMLGLLALILVAILVIVILASLKLI